MKSPNNPPKKPAFKDFRPPGRPFSLKRKKEQAKAVVDRLRQAHPDARCELYYETPYQLLVSVVLSAQATDKTVNRVMQPLYEAGFDPETVLKWGEAGLLERIRQIGLAPTKSRNVVKLSRILVDDYAGEIPRTRDELQLLPGVGRKTANVILGELFGEPTLAVDTHVYRVGMRLGLHTANSPDKAESELLAVISPDDLPLAHHLLILHGRYTCKSQKPDCPHCPLTDVCPTYPHLTASAPAKTAAKAKTRKIAAAAKDPEVLANR